MSGMTMHEEQNERRYLRAGFTSPRRTKCSPMMCVLLGFGPDRTARR